MKYTVVVSPVAECDLRDIGHYIRFHLDSPQAAVNTLGRIRRTIASLEDFPLRHRLSDVGSLGEKGVRITHARNYSIFYTTDEQTGTVRILRVLYSGRDIGEILFDLS